MKPELAHALRRTVRMLCVLLPVAVAMLLTAHYLPGWIYGAKEEASEMESLWQKKVALAQLQAMKAVPPPVPPPELPAMAVPPRPPPPQIQKEVVIKPVPVPVPVPASAPQQARPPAASHDNHVLLRNTPSTPSVVLPVPPATPVVVAVPVPAAPSPGQVPQPAPINPVPAPVITNALATNLTSTNLAQAVTPPVRTNTTSTTVRTNASPQATQASSSSPAPGRGFVAPSNLPLPPASPDIIRLSIP